MLTSMVINNRKDKIGLVSDTRWYLPIVWPKDTKPRKNKNLSGFFVLKKLSGKNKLNKKRKLYEKNKEI